MTEFGSFDATPKNTAKISRRDFMKVASLLVGSAVLTSCAKNTDEYPDSMRIEQILPPELLSGLGELRITPLSPATGVQYKPIGTTQVLLENQNYLVLNTAQHVGRSLWKNVTVTFPYGHTNSIITVDATIEAPGGRPHTESDWWIEDVAEETPVRTIIIHKPKDFDRYIVDPKRYGVLQAIPEAPMAGDKFYAGGFAGDQSGKLVFTELTYRGTTKPGDTDAGIPLFEFDGRSSLGMSGAAIFRQDGKVAAILDSGATIDQKSMTWGIPYAENQPIEFINKVLQP